jgi:hypothetical protein
MPEFQRRWGRKNSPQTPETDPTELTEVTEERKILRKPPGIEPTELTQGLLSVCPAADYRGTYRFNRAELSGDWAHLTKSGWDGYDHVGHQFPELPHPCPRGISVHISQIVWIADAPQGS